MHLRLLISFLFLTFLTYSFSANALTTPNVSANALFLYQNSNFHQEDTNAAALDDSPNGLNIQEAELQFYSEVDPYTRLSLLLAIAPSYESDGTTVSEKWGIEPEELFAESNAVSNLSLKIGKFKAAMGKHNTLHTHAFVFINAPLANTKLLGDEGFNDVGVSAAVLVPSSWFNEVTLQYLRGKGENEEFKAPSPASGVGLLHWKNLVDLSEDLTLELGASYAEGKNSFSQQTSLAGADLTFKWRPSQGGKYQSLLWATEYLARTQSQAGVLDEKGSGIATWLQYQFAERLSGTYRYESFTMKESFDVTAIPNDTTERNSLGMIYTPSEFSSYKLEMGQTHGGILSSKNETTEKVVFVQANFTIGAHPAHSY